MSDDKLRAYTKLHSNAAAGAETQTVFAATVILLRDSAQGMETLMLRKNSKIAFGGMGVFPGGRIDDANNLETIFAPLVDSALTEPAPQGNCGLSTPEVQARAAAECGRLGGGACRIRDLFTPARASDDQLGVEECCPTRSLASSAERCR